jgi:glutaredoxin
MRNSTSNGAFQKKSTANGTTLNQGLDRHIPLRFLTIYRWNPAVWEGYNPTVLESRQVVVYSRKGCHLCEVVKESLTKLSRRGGFTWQEIDVDSDGELRRQFNDEVPVVFIDGRKAFKYRMDEREFLKKLVS